MTPATKQEHTVSTVNEAPRIHVNLPGFTFDGYGERSRSAMFGVGVPFDLYVRQGNKTADLRTWEAQELSALKNRGPDADPATMGMMYSQSKGTITVYVAVRT